MGFANPTLQCNVRHITIHRRRGMLLWSFFVLIDNNTPKILLYIQYLYCNKINNNTTTPN